MAKCFYNVKYCNYKLYCKILFSIDIIFMLYLYAQKIHWNNCYIVINFIVMFSLKKREGIMNSRMNQIDILEEETIDLSELFLSVLKYFKLIIVYVYYSLVVGSLEQSY